MTDDPMELNAAIQQCADRLRHVIKPVMSETRGDVMLSSTMLLTAMLAWLGASGDRELAAKYFDDVANGLRSGTISFDHRGEKLN